MPPMVGSPVRTRNEQVGRAEAGRMLRSVMDRIAQVRMGPVPATREAMIRGYRQGAVAWLACRQEDRR
jgi:hypothetical protein